MKTHRLGYSSDLGVPPAEVLGTVTMAGVNAELRPWARMTAPRPWSQGSIFEWPQQQPLFHSWILFLCILPVDRHHFRLESVDPGSGFVENSSSLINRLWRHERRVIPTGEGCRITDRLDYSTRLPLLGWLLKPVYALVFRQRHRNLRRRFCRDED